MTPEDIKYFDNYFSLFVSEGWRQFIEEANDSIKGMDLTNCKTWEDYLKRNTELVCLKRIVNFETLIRRAYDNINHPTDLEIN